MQLHSLESQSVTIALYAARRGLSIVRSYEDAGKSGLSAQRRTALQSLISDIRMGHADFSVILVLDVSRWGRFQDSDESAYYEFICKEAGVRVEYCAELFENDGSLATAILKHIKRAMAGEFSRELSGKVFAGQARSVQKGYFVGSKPGYGLRRCIVDPLGNRKQVLEVGQRKAITTDRIILVHGPASEVTIVQDVYSKFVDSKLSLQAIARQLNDRCVLNAEGRKWTGVAVKELLSNEKYVGTSLYNRTSKKLNAKPVKNPTSVWIATKKAFDPVVTDDQFRKAQLQLVWNARGYTQNEMLDSLTAVWCSAGRLSAGVLETSAQAPGVNAYKEHFGSLVEAYRRIGYPGHYSSGKSSDIRRIVTTEIIERLKTIGCHVSHERGSSRIIVNEELHIAVVTGRTDPPCGKNTWLVGRSSEPKPDLMIAVRVDNQTSRVKEYLFLPLLFLPNGMWLTITSARLDRIKTFRSKSLEPLYRLCARQELQ